MASGLQIPKSGFMHIFAQLAAGGIAGLGNGALGGGAIIFCYRNGGGSAEDRNTGR